MAAQQLVELFVGVQIPYVSPPLIERIVGLPHHEIFAFKFMEKHERPKDLVRDELSAEAQKLFEADRVEKADTLQELFDMERVQKFLVAYLEKGILGAKMPVEDALGVLEERKEEIFREMEKENGINDEPSESGPR